MRRVALIVAIVFGLAVLPIAATRAAWAGSRGAERVPVLLYHHIVAGEAQIPLEVGATSFARQMSYLRLRGFHFASMREVEDFAAGSAGLPNPTVLVTLDDGFQDNYTVAYPIIKSLGVRATIFVITSFVGTPGYLTAAEIGEMQASGLVEFQLHTNALHYKTEDGQSAVLAVPPEALTADLETARAKLAAWTGKTADAFAYPFGFYNDAVGAPLNAAHVATAFTVEPGYVQPGDNLYQLHRIPVFWTLHLLRFISYVENLSPQ